MRARLWAYLMLKQGTALAVDKTTPPLYCVDVQQGAQATYDHLSAVSAYFEMDLWTP